MIVLGIGFLAIGIAVLGAVCADYANVADAERRANEYLQTYRDALAAFRSSDEKVFVAPKRPS